MMEHLKWLHGKAADWLFHFRGRCHGVRFARLEWRKKNVPRAERRWRGVKHYLAPSRGKIKCLAPHVRFRLKVALGSRHRCARSNCGRWFGAPFRDQNFAWMVAMNFELCWLSNFGRFEGWLNEATIRYQISPRMVGKPNSNSQLIDSLMRLHDTWENNFGFKSQVIGMLRLRCQNIPI